MHDDVRTICDWLDQRRRGNRVIDYQRHAMFVRSGGQRFNIGDIARRIADGLAKTAAVLSSINASIFPGCHQRQTHVDAEFGQHVGEQRHRTAVEQRHRDDVGSCFGNGQGRRR